MRLMQFMFVFLALSGAIFSAYVYGGIYRSDFEKVNKTAIKIDGRFSYQLVTDKANYSIFLPEGNFTISASSFDDSGNLLLYANEPAAVGSADQRIDIVLKPVQNSVNYLIYLAGILLVALVAALAWALKSMPKSAQNAVPVRKAPVEKNGLDPDAKSVLRVLDSQERRTTQTEIKEALNFSDAKLSLILTELEQLGYVQKFKRGRGNIIKKL